MRNETPNPVIVSDVVERSETQPGNVTGERMFRIRGVAFVPVFYERDVVATDLEAACAQFADSIAKNRDGGVPSWGKRSPAYVAEIGETPERFPGTIPIVPKRYRVPQFGT